MSVQELLDRGFDLIEAEMLVIGSDDDLAGMGLSRVLDTDF